MGKGDADVAAERRGHVEEDFFAPALTDSGTKFARFGESPTDIQAFVGESVNVTSRVADQLRSISGLDVAQFSPVQTCPSATLL